MTARRLASAALCVLVLLACLSGCAGRRPVLSGCPVSHETEFGGVYIRIPIDDFNALGFACGDSVKIAFSNGYVLEDVPYYNGYYTAAGEPLLVAYPGYPYVKAGINSGDDLYVTAGLADGDTATVTLVGRGRYRTVQEARDLHYSDVREKFDSDEQFANFRAVRAGDIREGALYRSASPCDDQHRRAKYVDALISGAGVRFILDLADDGAKIDGYVSQPGFACPYFLSLREEGLVEAIALNMNFASEEFREKTAKGLAALAEHEGPYLVHCTEGKDRTGYVCMLLEALCGASYEEIVRDYLVTYENYYGITEEEDADRCEVIVSSLLDPMILSLSDDPGADVRTMDLAAAAESRLLESGMTKEEIGLLRERLTGPAAGN